MRRIIEAECRVPRFEFLRGLEEAYGLAILGVGGLPIPGCRRKLWRGGFDELMEPLSHTSIWFRHPGDSRERGAFPRCLVLICAFFRLHLFGALPHRGFFLSRESLGLLGVRDGALCDCFCFFHLVFSLLVPGFES